MKKADFSDGICDNCGNVGLAGEKCLNCGGIFSKVDENLVDTIVHNDDDDFVATKKPDVYPLEVLEKEEKEDDETI